MRIDCTWAVVDETLSLLKETGASGTECVVLWLGKRGSDSVTVVDAFRPVQIVQSHSFWIPPEGMDQLKDRLRLRGWMVAAQVHTHPKEAFHSEADDRWAIVRHEGALSLVLPRFALETDRSSFVDNTKVFQLSETDEWCEVPSLEVPRWLAIS